MNEDDILNIENTVAKAESLIIMIKDACITNELYDEQTALEIALQYIKQTRERIGELRYQIFIKPLNT